MQLAGESCLTVRFGGGARAWSQDCRGHGHRIRIQIEIDIRQSCVGTCFRQHGGTDYTRGVGFPDDLSEREEQGDGQADEHCDDQRGLPARLLFGKARAEPVDAGHDRRHQRDRHEIGDVKQQRAGKDGPVGSRQAETDDAQRRHQRGRDGDADNRALAPPDHRVCACEGGEHRHGQIEQIGLRARGDFRRHGLQGRDEHDQRSQRHAQHRARRQRHRRSAQPAIVPDRKGETSADDRPHQGRDQHGADHDGRRGQ